jgi:outer membrane protein assembly factor BamB
MRAGALVAAVAAVGACDEPKSGATAASAGPSRVSVLTQHNDNARTGANLGERELTPDVVRTQLGFLFALPVDGQIYAQPLYVANLDFRPGESHDTLFVATEHDSVYAFDADHPGAPLWQASIGTPAGTDCLHEVLLAPELGITGTPVIDPKTRTLYVVAFTVDDPARCDEANFHQVLWALDLVTGTPRLPPVEIADPVFTARQELQRAALLLADGVLYVAFASHQDRDPYHGWLFAYDAATLTRRATCNTSPTALDGSIWMSGQGPAVDEAGNIYVSTGNGPFDGRDNWGDSLLKLALADDHFVIVDSFTPFN